MPPLILGRPRPGWRVALLAVVLAGSALAGPPGSSAISRAFYADADAAGGSLRTDTLDPPTALGATGGTNASLSWTPSVDTYPAGYAVYRATALAGPYAQIGSATPRTATSYTDAPAPGTYYYEVATYQGSWLSVVAGPAAATVVPSSVSTGYKACVGASNGADTSSAGDGNGYQTTPNQACALDGVFATDVASGNGGTQSCGVGAVPSVNKDRHRWWGFAFGLPASVTSVNGIQVQAAIKLNNATGTTNLCAQLSGDGGGTWTTIQSLPVTTGTTLTTLTFGSTSDTWGQAWSAAQLGAASFRLRIIDASSLTTKNFILDALSAQITYTP